MNRNSMKKAQGFTLIELIIVIIILGILAVTAAPKFIDIQGDARGATLKGVKASLLGAGQLVHGKSALAGNEKSPAGTSVKVVINGADVLLNYGYPKATEQDLLRVLDISTDDFTFVSPTAATDPVSIHIYPTGGVSPTATPAAGTCFVTYTEADGSGTPLVITAPTAVVTATGC